MLVARCVPASNDKRRIPISLDRRKFNDVYDARLFRNIDESINDCRLIRNHWRKEKNCSYACEGLGKRSLVRKIELAQFEIAPKLPRGFGLITHRRSDSRILSAETLNDIPPDSAGGAGYEN